MTVPNDAASPPAPMVQATALAAFLVIAAAAGAIGSAATLPSIPGWYEALAKPVFTPPNWLFPPVWTALYVMMAIAAWLVWRAAGARASIRASLGAAHGALALWLGQLVLNALWSVLFFGLHRPGLALLEILVLWLLILATLRAFRRISPAAAWLMLPYLLWVSYAVALNAGVWWLN